MKKVLVYPRYSNPYQSLLYDEMKKSPDLKIKYLSEDISRFGGYILMCILPYFLIKNRISGYSIFHLHWVLFTPLSQNKVMQSISLIYVLCIISFIKLIGYKLVWTVHNILPHNTMTVNDIFITKFLCKVSDAKIVHASYTITELKELECDTRNVFTIPHGNYICSYENKITKKEARIHLNINDKEFIFLFFGEIKLYKGIEELLKAFQTISQNQKHVTLVIAGKSYDTFVKKILERYASGLKNRIKLFLRYIEVSEVQYYLNAANVVVYPFKKITTSGSVLLALSFGKPIIYPVLGALQALPATVGFSYPSDTSDGLLNAMQEAMRCNESLLIKKGRAAYTYAESLSWDKIAVQTMAVYQQI